MSLSFEQEAAATDAVSNLQAELQQTAGNVANYSTSDSGRSGLITALNQAAKLIDALRGRYLDYVRSGEWAWEKWVDQAASCHSLIADVSGASREWTWTNILLKTASQTVTDVRQGAQNVVDDVKDAAKSVGGGFGVGVILAGIVVAYIWWKS